MRRVLLATTLLLLALAGALAAARARRLGARLDALAVEPGGDLAAVPQIGDDLPAGPCRWAVISNVCGDHAALGDAMGALAARGDIDFVILRGDVLGSGDDAECRKLAASFRDRGLPVLAAPGPRDRAHLDAFQRWISPPRWSFRSKGHEFRSEEVAAGAPATRGVEIRVAPGGATVASMELGRALASAAWRVVALDVLDPVVRTRTGYVAFLAACAALASLGLTRSGSAKATRNWSKPALMCPAL